MENLHEIVAIVQCGWKRANDYLDNGYILLQVGEWATERKMETAYIDNNTGEKRERSFIAKGSTFILGRTKETPAWNPAEQPVDEPVEA